jgi:PASTA domain
VPFSLVASVTAKPGINGGTSSAIDTTGATAFIVGISSYQSNAVTLSDSKGNTWTGLTNRTVSNASHRFFYVNGPPTVGTGHTFTVSGTTIYPTVFVLAFSGGIVAGDGEAGATSSSSSGPLASGPMTPGHNGALVVTGACVHLGTTFIAPVGFTSLTESHGAGTSMGAGIGYLEQTTAASVNPSWDWTTAGSSVVAVAAFTTSAAASVRTSQAPIELLSQPVLPSSRVTHALVETLSTTGAIAAPSRLTQLAVELLGRNLSSVPAVIGLTLAEATAALAAEDLVVGTVTGGGPTVLAQSPAAGTVVLPGSAVDLTFADLPLRLTQLALEVYRRDAAPVRLTQLALEVYRSGLYPARLSQAAVEVYTIHLITGRVSQQAVEWIQARSARTRVSQAVVELWITAADGSLPRPSQTCPVPFFDPDTDENWS